MDTLLKKHFEKIITITDEEFEKVYPYFSFKKLKKHQFLVQEGSKVINDHFVLKGLLKACHTDEEGKEYIMQFAMEDWWITDYQAYFNQSAASLNIECIEDVEVLCLSLRNRDLICAEFHKIEHFFRKKSNMGYVALQSRILSMLMNNAKERYDQLLALYPNLFRSCS